MKINQQKLIKRFLTLVKINSESYEEFQIIKYLTGELRGIGLKVYNQKIERTSNLIAVLEGDKHLEPIFFNAHMDTVSPGKNIKPIVTDKLIKSSGDTVLGSDDKAAIAIFLEGLEYIQKNKIVHPDIYIVFTSAEEQGLVGAKQLDFSMIGARKGYSFDGDGKIGTIILSAPTHYTYKINVKGKSAHAGIAPEKGKNAIKIASDLILHIKMGKLDNETSANVGIVQGGRATNIVPDSVYIAGEIRSRNNETLKKAILELKDNIKKMKKRYKTSIKLNLKKEYSGFKFEKDSYLVKQLARACRDIEIRPIYEHSNGGSDANIFNQNKLQCLNIGVGMKNVHSTDEFILIKDLVNGLKLFITINKNMGLV